MRSTFGSHNVIIQHITEADFRTFMVGFDIDNAGDKKFRWKNLINILQDVLPEFAFGFHEGTSVSMSRITSLLTDSAKALYKIDEFIKTKEIYLDNSSHIDDDDIDSKYLKRGEFGELILHLLLREFLNTIPLLSKIYFKDSYGVPVHGFDAIHIDPTTKTIWLGESKLYVDGKKGINALIEDLKHHFTTDFLNQEFTIISKKIKLLNEKEVPEKDFWLDLMDKNKALKDVFPSINIPMICTYSSNLFKEYDDETDPEFLLHLEEEVRNLQRHFNVTNNHKNKTQLNIVLLLFPIECKNTLVKKMHKKLYTLQGIYDDE